MQKEGMEEKCLEALSSIIEKRKDFENDILERIAFKLAYKGSSAKYCKQAVELYEMVADEGTSSLTERKPDSPPTAALYFWTLQKDNAKWE